MSDQNIHDAQEWLTVYSQCAEQIQLMQEAITKRHEKMANKSLDSAENTKLVEMGAKLKKDLRTMKNDLGALDAALKNLTSEISGREIGRRRDQLNELVQRREELVKLLSKKPSSNSSSRKNLLGAEKRGSSKSGASEKEEPDSIKGMQMAQVISYQNQVMDQQDQGLDMLSQALDRTKHIGLSIRDELDEHKVLLDDLDRDVEKTDVRVNRETRRIDKLLKGGKMPLALCIIIVLFCIIIALVIVVLKFSKVF